MRYKEAEIIFNMYRGESRRKKEITQSFSWVLGQLSHDPFHHALTPERNQDSVAQKVSFKLLRFRTFLQVPEIFKSKSLGPISCLQEGNQFGCHLSPGRNNTALFLLWVPHRGTGNRGECSPIISLMPPPAFPCTQNAATWVLTEGCPEHFFRNSEGFNRYFLP